MAESKLVTTDPRDGASARVQLSALWPRPDRWTDLIATRGTACAVRLMVTYDNVAVGPPPTGWMGVPAATWDAAYRFAIEHLQAICCDPKTTTIDAAQQAYDSAMQSFAEMAKLPVPMSYWRFAAGIIGTHSPRHPLHFNAMDTLRWKYLPEWGWGRDPRVSDYLAVGALRIQDRDSRQTLWKSVKGSNRRWVNLDARTFKTEREALDVARVIVESQYLSPPGTFCDPDQPK